MGKRTSTFVHVSVSVNMTAAALGTDDLVGRIGRLCANSGPKAPKKFKIKIELTGLAKLLFVSTALNKVVEPMDIDCPQSIKPDGSFLELDDDLDAARSNRRGDGRWARTTSHSLVTEDAARLRGAIGFSRSGDLGAH